MLTTTTRNVANLGLGGIYVAHVIRTEDTTGKYSYILGLSLANGRPIGMVVQANGKMFRRFARFVAVEDFLAVFKPNVAMISLYPADGPVQRIKDVLIETYMLDNPIMQAPLMEVERQRLLSALSPDRAGTDGRNSDTADT
ncbi:hypothetical protein Q4511_10955 [Paracoccus sp. 1_MG-2023]|uniref:hypothetical protein n=1 Tax=unclassified Paracoccus (in: a-proteobacteria) TaxID=2688777 RepID=UPI001C087125|nr:MULTISPECIES: hypothetical protein [unclassified Paracoccus (in: a-proteobacteria)]MBU2959159.1 hypothetical protein [Paracoccus sp. C2R09]MDO6669442.1 hypothetical protein [Paracoccus sp. 1_MG-2023]